MVSRAGAGSWGRARGFVAKPQGVVLLPRLAPVEKWHPQGHQGPQRPWPPSADTWGASSVRPLGRSLRLGYSSDQEGGPDLTRDLHLSQWPARC